MGDNKITLHHIRMNNIKNQENNVVVSDNVVILSENQHKAAHILKNDRHNIEMAMSILDNNSIYYKLGYTDAVNNNVNNQKLNVEQERIYMDGFMSSLDDIKNNTIDKDNILTKTYLKMLEQFFSTVSKNKQP